VHELAPRISRKRQCFVREATRFLSDHGDGLCDSTIAESLFSAASWLSLHDAACCPFVLGCQLPHGVGHNRAPKIGDGQLLDVDGVTVGRLVTLARVDGPRQWARIRRVQNQSFSSCQ
jgi:hypothetical protein